MPPLVRPIPRHIAEPPHELEPSGRWADQLSAVASSRPAPRSKPTSSSRNRSSTRSAGIRSAPTPSAPTSRQRLLNADGVEFFGYVSFKASEHSDPSDFSARADYTHEIAANNPDWKIDLNEEVIGILARPARRQGRRHSRLGNAARARAPSRRPRRSTSRPPTSARWSNPIASRWSRSTLSTASAATRSTSTSPSGTSAATS